MRLPGYPPGCARRCLQGCLIAHIPAVLGLASCGTCLISGSTAARAGSAWHRARRKVCSSASLVRLARGRVDAHHLLGLSLQSVTHLAASLEDDMAQAETDLGLVAREHGCLHIGGGALLA